jgi:hypothetical protein
MPNATFSPKATTRASSPALSAGISGLFSSARPLGSERLEESMLLNRKGKGQLKPLNLSGFPWPNDLDQKNEAAWLQRVRQEKLFQALEPTWEQFCPKYLRISRAEAVRQE